MTVTFNSNLKYVAISYGMNINSAPIDGIVYPGLACNYYNEVNPNDPASLTPSDNGNRSAITIYSGTQPTALGVINNWSLYNSSNNIFLAHYNGAIWAQGSTLTSNITSVTVLPPAVNPTNAGIATWAIIWPSNASISALNSSTIPSNYFLVCSASLIDGTGIVKFYPNLIFTLGIPKSITDVSIPLTLS